MVACPRPVIFGLAGTVPTVEERRFFTDAKPLGFILFARNCEDPEQVAALSRSLREIVGRPEALILIDQEGGRVQRLRPPRWRAAPPAAPFGALAAERADRAVEATYLNHRLIAADLYPLGISVDCTPVLDVQCPGAHEVIGDRSFSADPERVALLARAACDGLLAGGVLPVIKHIPGHGRAAVDSHLALPVVEAHRAVLEACDFAPFRALADAPMAMTAHVVYTALDASTPATTSRRVIDEVIRKSIGFQGLLLSDDLCMKALDGDPGERARRALGAGCDVLLHCNGNLDEMQKVAEAANAMTTAALQRLVRALAMRREPEPFDAEEAASKVQQLLHPPAAAALA